MSVDLGKIKQGPSYKPYLILFIIASLVLIAFVIHTTISKAEITLHPKEDTTNASLNVTISPDADGNLTAFNAVKGQIIEKTIDATKTFDAVEKKEVDSYAKGTVTIYNNRSEPQPLKQKTQLLSDSGVLFKIDTWAQVPAKGKIDIPVTAAEKGAQGNVAPTHFVIVKLWANWQELIYAESNTPMTGGRVEDFVVTAETIEKAKEDVATQIIQEEIAKIKETLPPSEIIVPKTTHYEIINATPKVKEDDITPAFEVTEKIKLTLVSFNTAQMKTIAEEKIQKQISEAKEIISFNTDDLSYSLASIDEEKRSAIVTISASAATINKIPSKAFEKAPLQGRNYGDLVAYYKQFPEVDSVDIAYSPFWVTKVPSSDSNIEILVK
ncbi:baseplate J/gp47 family protein [Patescibacteria group bacterium]|nr:baseplate J/gp47 family protein [Patescibacteria group bacterium]